MLQSVLHVTSCIVLHLVASQHADSSYQHEARTKYLANRIEEVVKSEATKIALAKDDMQETVSDAVESIESQLVELYQIADAIRRKNLNKSCLQTTMLINTINLNALRACNCLPRFDALNQIVDNTAKLYATLKNVSQTCKSADSQDNCQNQLLEGIEASISELTESIDNSIEQITSSYLGCIQEELSAIDNTLNDIGHKVQQCV
nr:unnamed protein product [Callosobruchus chinensis]